MNRQTKLGSYTLGSLYSDCQDMMSVYTDEDINLPLFTKTINRVVYKLNELSGLKDAEKYKERVEVPVIKSVTAEGVTGSGFVSADNALTLPYAGAAWINEETGFNDFWVSAEGTLLDSDSGLIYAIRITAITDSENVLVVSKTGDVIPNIAAADLVVNLTTQIKKETDVINLAMLPGYKHIDRIEKITYTTVAGSTNEQDKRRVIFPVDTNQFDGMKQSENYKRSVLAYQEGEYLYFAKGSGISKYNERYIHVVSMPEPMVEESDYIDVTNSNIPQVLDATMVILYRGIEPEKIKKAMPQELLNWWKELEAGKKATAEEKKGK